MIIPSNEHERKALKMAKKAGKSQSKKPAGKKAATRKPGRPPKKKPGNKGGRPTKYDPSMADRAHELCRDAGLTDKQLGTAFGVDETSINRWKQEHEDFREAVLKGKDEFDTRHAEAALLKAALGYLYTEIYKELTDEGLIVTKTVTKQAAPNPTCLIFWLKNRNPQRWKDKQEHEIDSDEQPLVVITKYGCSPEDDLEEGNE
jgi:transcriptional regulator with XRE-family HTH domain